MCDTALTREAGKVLVFLLDAPEVVRRGVHEMLFVEPDRGGRRVRYSDRRTARIPATRPDVAVPGVSMPSTEQLGPIPSVMDGEPFGPARLTVDPEFVTVHSVTESDQRRLPVTTPSSRLLFVP